jgi:hypothetical protein
MFTSVKFREADARSYTYFANEAYSPGDRVLVDVKGEQKIVIVDAVDLPEPSFTCKPILGRATEKAADPDTTVEDLL